MTALLLLAPRYLEWIELGNAQGSLKATYERRRELFNHPEQWKGWKLTVLYQDLTLDGIPRFPIGKALRKSTE